MKESMYFFLFLMIYLMKNKAINTEQLDENCPGFPNSTQDSNENKCLSGNNTLKQLGPNNVESFMNNNCFCDEKCVNYGDCCPDIHNTSNNPWKCRPLNFNSGINIYMIQRCATDWNNDDVRQLCEEEPYTLFKIGKYYHHLQEIPVYSLTSGLIYRNLFCATCNRDVNLEKWNTNFNCKDQIKGSDLANAIYQPSKKEWIIETENGTEKTTCIIEISELQTLSNVINHYNGRRCKGIFSCSPSWKNVDDIQKCKLFKDVQYLYKSKENAVPIHYKNSYCAICNYLDVDKLYCYNNLKTPSFDDGVPKSIWYPNLIDFNSDGKSESRCDSKQLYDPILKVCFNLSCDHLSERNGKQCIDKPKNATGNFNRSCTKIIFSRDSFVLLDNDTIFVNITMKSYTSKHYEPVIINGEIMQILICAEEIFTFNFSPIQSWMSEIGLLISIACLLIHLIIYFLLPKLHNLPGKILICLSLSLLIAQMFFLLGAYDPYTSTWHCNMIGIIIHFSYLAAFFWMNVMAFDIYRTFCQTRSRSINSHTFLKYSVYGWISPLLIIIAALIMNFLYSHNLYSPNYGESICWISQKRGLFVFFALPLFVLLIINLILFFLTARSLLITTRETKIVNKFSDKVRFFLYIKIALLLGLTWIFGFVATLTNVSFLWYPFIIFNSLQGAFIFLSFTMKKKVFDYLRERFFGKKHKKKNQVGQLKQCSSTSNLSTIQTSLTTSLSTSLPVLCNQTELIKAMINRKIPK